MNRVVKNNEFEVRYKKVAPDGGWGFMIGIGMMLPMICAFGIIPTFGLIFGDFLKQFGNETSTLTLIMGTSICAFSFTGLFTNTLSQRFSMQSVGTFGACLFTISWILTIFVTSPIHLLFTYGILGGAAFGLILPPSFAIFNTYFVKNRIMAMSVVQTFIGIGVMVWPLLVKYLFETFGFRGGVAMMAAINAHSILGMLLMQPVEMHLRIVEITDYEMGEKVNNGNTIHDNSELMEKPNQSNDYCCNGDEVSENKKANEIYFDDGNGNCWTKMISYLDLSLLKDPVYINIVMSLSLIGYVDMVFSTIQPMYLIFLGFSNQDVAYLISIGSAADVISRVVLAVYSSCVNISGRTMFMGAAVVSVAARIAYARVFDFTGLAIVTGILGCLRSYIHIPTPIIFGEYLPPERFSSGFGLFIFLQGNFCFVLSPLIGWVRDVTKSFTIALYCLAVMAALGVILWAAELIIVKCKRSNKNGVVQ